MKKKQMAKRAHMDYIYNIYINIYIYTQKYVITFPEEYQRQLSLSKGQGLGKQADLLYDCL